MTLVTSLQTDTLDMLFGSGSAARIGNGPSSYVGVCFTNPGETGLTSDEADYGGRKQILSTGWNAPSAGQIDNSAFLSPWITTGTALLQYFLLADGATANSTHDFAAQLVAPVSVVLNDQIRFPVGGIIVSVLGLLTHSYANDLLDIFLRNAALASLPSDYHYALSTTTPSADGTGFTEPGVGSYARAQYARGAIFGAAVSGSPSTITSINEVLWPLPTAAWGTVTYWGAYDAPTGGNLLFYGPLDAPTVVDTAEQPYLATGGLTLTMD